MPANNVNYIHILCGQW